MLFIFILAISALLQFSAAFLALRLIKVTQKTHSWILISAALCLMGIRRIIPIYYFIYIPGNFAPDTIIEIIGLVLSVFMLLGVISIRSLLTGRKEAEERYQNLLDNMMEGYQVIGLDWRYIYINDAVSMHGKKNRGDLIGNTMMKIYPGIENTELFSVLKLCMEKRSYHHIENEFIYPDGSKGWFDLSIQPVPDGISILSIDITERKRAEKTMMSEQSFTKALLDSLPGIFYLYTYPGLHLVRWNRNHETLLGFDPGEINNRHIMDWHIPEAKEAVQKAVEMVMGNNQLSIESPLLTKDGRPIPFLMTGVRFEVNDNSYLMGVGIDITERKLAEDELQKYREHLEELVKERTAELEKINANLQIEIAERKRMEEEVTNGRNMLRTLIDSLPDEIYAKDSESKYIMANSRILSSFGLKEFHEIIGKTDFNFMPQNEAMSSYRDENSVLRARGKIVNFEKPVSDPDGNIYWYAITKVPMYDKDGRITGLVGIKRDITDFKEAEENLHKAKESAETANRAKSMFLSNMSHEIRTPMNAIMGFSELMLHDENLTGNQADWIKTIYQSGEHLLMLINDILEISRIEAGRTAYNPTNFNLHTMLKEIEEMFRIKTNSKKLHFIVESSNDLPKYIFTDEAKLRQIFINIVGNAVKFTDEGGIALRVRTGQNKNGKMNLIAEVEDTGPGIPEKDIKVLFQMFGQTETGIKEGGTGLGLAISQQYAKIMDGLVTVESMHNKGTCFTITVQIMPGKEIENKDPVKNRVIGLKPGESYRVLIADDRENNRKLLRDTLLSIGFKVEEAKDGLEAIKKFKAWLPDIILMDMRMPVMDGYEAIRNIKSMSSIDDKKIPIIAVTASAFTEDKNKALEAGADTYLRKPFKEDELLASIEFCLGVQYIYE